MDRLRPRPRLVFTGFTDSEVEKMEKFLVESKEELLSKEFCQKIAKSFNISAGRSGKPIVKWTEVQSWFKSRQQDNPSKRIASSTSVPKSVSVLPEAFPPAEHESSQRPRGGKVSDLSEMEFEARSSKDGAWYDVEMFLAHRFVSSGEAEVRVRFVGFGAEEDEWVNVKTAVRERSVPLEHSDCHRLKVGDLVLCFQERRDQAIYYDSHIVEIQRRMHDIRGCRCLFLIRYNHDNTEERVRLRRLCTRPTF
ncbi:protein SAWADEE HOMEODOMAIN HOMOLOG 1-like isoform X2 [Mangifera indica]|uniref:protein SAWADEE HOMEODOMAIN HOMOLOG 1-like isoform X2 n=1 Tax=Mangifera indica TaxID=29780 RepID=UPI001CFA44BB|nr:protein SAWADEE HOMEODOMAIN HOMOLOG 1-like isoform X2 [Mangifera indica]